MAQRVKTDWVLFFSIVLMVCFGLLMVYSSSSIMARLKFGSDWYYLKRQLGWAAVSFAFLITLKRTDYRRMNSATWAFAPMAVVVTLLLIVYLVDSHTHRWLRLGPVGIQPSEFAKPALILFLAYFVAQRAKLVNDRHTLGPAVLAVGLLSVSVVIADLGTAVVLVATATVVFLTAGLKWRYLAWIALIALVGTSAAVISRPYRLGRIIGFVDPEFKLVDRIDRGGKIKGYLQKSLYTRDPGYHVRQSKIAVGSGGVAGEGLMQGKQKLFYLPEAHTDFIYAVVGEELGLIGCGSLLAIFLVILWRGLQTARHTPDQFGRLIAVGVTTMIVFQAFMNMSVVLGMGPTKGIPLPMISYGGSSLLSTLASLGLLLSVSEQSG
jgi:cell division protein FtsW